jgi:hypothetical protein
MANPNMANSVFIFGSTAYLTPATTATNTSFLYASTANGITSITGLTPPVGSINRIGSILATNITPNTTNVTVGVSNQAPYSATGVNFLAYQVSIPPNSSLIVTDKSVPVYVTEYQAVGVTTGVANSVSFVVNLETIT